MTIKFAHRIKESTATTGTGTYSLAGALTGFAAFSSFLADTETTVYCCTNNTDWEIGIGTFTSGAPATLARTQIIESSNTNAAVSWSTGDKDIFCTQPSAIPNLLTADPVGSLTSPNTITPGSGGIALGHGNSDTGTHNIILGENCKILSPAVGCIAMGKDAVGRFSNNLVFSPGKRLVNGDTQVSFRFGTLITTDNYAAFMTSLDLRPSGSNTGAVFFELDLLCRQVAGTGTIGSSRSWTFRGISTFNNSSIVYAVNTASNMYHSGGLPSTAASFSTVSLNPLVLQGETDKEIHWLAMAKLVELSNGT